MLVTLAPRDQRSRNATADHRGAARARRPRAGHHASTCSRCRTSPSRTASAARSSSSRWRIRTRTVSASGCRSWSSGCRQSPHLADVASDLQDRGLQAFLDIDRDAASRLGVRVAAIDDALYDAFGQRLISTIYTQANQYRVVLEVAPRFQIGPEALGHVFVRHRRRHSRFRSPTSPKIEHRNTALVINHAGQFPAVTMSFNLAPGASLGKAVEAIEAAQRELGMPASIQTTFQGAAAAFRASLDSTLFLVLAAIVTMYIVLGVLYESYIHPITILSTLPSAGVGALLALLFTGTDLSLIAVIGIILLIGIVKKNAIMMIDFALDAERNEGMSPHDAIYKAALLRFRPILMTTLAALFGALPLMLSTGSGAEMRQPLGLVMVGGLLVSQVLTLFTTPAIYLFFDRLGRAWRPSTQLLRREGCDRMNLSAPFIARPVATTLLSLSVVLVGALGYTLLPVSPLPQMDFPAITVSASLPGASPETMASSVATPLERALGTIAGVNEISSQSSQGSTRINIQFDLGQEHRLGRARGAGGHQRLPLAAAERAAGHAVVPEDQPSQAPIMLLALTSNTTTTSELYDLASTVLAQKVAQVTGVGDVTVGGGSLPAVRVELQPQALTQYGISLDEVRQAISSANLRRPKGMIEDSERHWQIQASDQLVTAEQYQPLIITYRNGAPVRLSDVARVYNGVEDRYNSGYFNDKPAVLLVVSRQTQANIIATVDGVTAQLPALRAFLPAGVSLDIASDRSPTIRATLHEAQQTLLIAVGLVILVVLLFLGRLRAAMIPVAAVPVALVGSCAVMYLWGFSLNNLSLMALIVATGLVVDDAIVVLENINRHVEPGKTPLAAALAGAKEVGFTLLSMNLSIVAVFVSILFMGGIVERLFREFSITLVAAILISLVVSITLTPMLCARWLVSRDERQAWTAAGDQRSRVRMAAPRLRRARSTGRWRTRRWC